MTGEHVAALDRYVQQDIGRAIREGVADGVDTNLPAEIERLLQSLKAHQDDAGLAS